MRVDQSPRLATGGEANKPPNFPIVGIGASAGGLESLEKLFDHMPSDSGMAFVVIQHLSPDFKSLMDELLARHTEMPIHRAENDMLVRPNHVYLLTPKMEMIIVGGRLRVTKKDPKPGLTLPIDQFFRSLAQDCGPRAVAIVLSGTGSDGSRGICEVARSGGLVLCENIESAKFDGMPLSAQETGVVDMALPPEEMAAVLQQRMRGEHLRREGLSDPSEEQPLEGIEAVFELLRRDYDLDFAHYKPTTVSRRIERRLALVDVPSLEDYVERLRDDRAELNSLYKDLLIGVTAFFRDTDAFEELRRDYLSELIRRVPTNEDLRVWVAGCATGEEAYSIAILLHEALEAAGRPINLKVLATDVHKASLEQASLGIYDSERLSAVSPERLRRYFVKRDSGYQISQDLRQLIVFAPHNIIRDAPFTNLDLIACRNLLIYFQPPAQKKALSLFHFGLKTGGILFLGSSESPGDLADEFETLSQHGKLFRKRRDIRLPAEMRLPLAPSTTLASRVKQAAAAPEPHPHAGLLRTYDALLDRFMPPSLLINEDRELLETFGGAEKWLQFKGRRVSRDLLDLLDADLKAAVAGALHRAVRSQQPVQLSHVVVKAAGNERVVHLSVEPVRGRHTAAVHYLVSLAPVDAPPSVPQPSPVDLSFDQLTRDRFAQMEEELGYTKENLQATVEEVETANEELQATNEELVASNEELQSTNEELHSVNEELYTVNAEHQKKNRELAELNQDMLHLLESGDIATVFLDRELRIRKFTPRVADIFDLVQHDVGRKIGSFTHNICYDGLLADLQQARDSGERVERDVRDRNGRCYFMRIVPYLAEEDVQGVVLTLVDISALEEARSEILHLSAIVESSADAITSCDLEGNILSWNQGAERLYGHARDEVIGKHLSLIVPPENHDEIGRLLDQALHGDCSELLETDRLTKDGRRIHVSLRNSPLKDRNGRVIGRSSIVRDITERKRADKEIRESVARRDRFLAMLSHELRNPLSAVRSATRLLSSDQISAETMREARDVLERQTSHMTRLLDDLLDIARFTQGKLRVVKEHVELAATTKVAVEEVNPFAAHKAILIDTRLPADPVWVLGDPARLAQAQANLLANAIKYSPRGSRVDLTVEQSGGGAVITVRDSGAGIPAPMLERIFEMFVQSESTIHRSEGGMGVGLTLVRSIVELHGGTVEAHSQGEGQGSEFVVRLPLAPTELPGKEEQPATLRASSRRILLVEDQQDARRMLCNLLEIDGHQVWGAADAATALLLAEQHQPDVAILDIGLPDMDGYQLARLLRNRAGGDRLQLIALTGFGQSEDVQKALEAGFDHHLVKPVKPAELDWMLANRTG